MPETLVSFAFSSGVIGEALFGRTDLEKYDSGLAAADNFFIDYRGGATSRRGTEFSGAVSVAAAAAGHKFFRFSFNSSIGNNYILLFLPNKILFLQSGAFILEPAKVVSGIVAGTVTSTAHGYSNGDYVEIDGISYLVAAVTTNTFDLLNMQGVAVAKTSGATSAYRRYSVTTPYAGADLAGLSCEQQRDQVRLTHNGYLPRTLTRFGHTNWTLTNFSFGGTSLAAPINLVGTASTSGAASVNFTVTAIDQEGRETALATILQIDNIVDFTNDPGSVRLTWDAVPGAKYYNIYRSVVFPMVSQNSLGQQLGYVGRSYTPSFTDANIIPNFALAPLQAANPFLPAQIEYIEITAGGSGYTSAPAVAVTGGSGSGFKGLTVLEAGKVVGVLVLAPGTNYSSPVVSFTGGGGTGAAATASLGPATGLFPGISILYNQRLWFMGSTAYPVNLFSGRGNDLENFNQASFLTADDPLQYELDSPELSPIKAAVAMNSSMFIFTERGVWQMLFNGGSYSVGLRTENGIGRTAPLKIDREIIFPLLDGGGVRGLRPGNLPDQYVDVDLTIFSGDFFSKEQEITAWTFAREPFRLIWGRQANGKFLSLTYVPEHNVYAWMPHSTRGYVLGLESVNENGISYVYFLIARDSGTFVERMGYRTFASEEDIWAVDCGLANMLPNPAAELTISGLGEFVSAIASGPVFSPSDVGAHVRAGGGRGIVVSYTSATQVELKMSTPIRARKPQEPDVLPTFAQGDWTLAPTQTVFSGLDHLEGESVEILADGSEVAPQVVTGGQITLAVPASKVIIGLPFTGYVKTLPLAASNETIEDRQKRIIGLSLRIKDSRGLYYGTDTIEYPLKERTNENYEQPTRFQTGLRQASVLAEWNLDGQIVVRKKGSGAAVSLLGVIYDVELGGDKN